MEKSELHKRIMRRVRYIHVLQWVFSPRMVKLGLFSLSVVGLASVVSVGNVIANMPRGSMSGYFSFTISAFANTTVLVQALFVIAIAAFIWLARDLAKHPHKHAHSFA